MNTLNESLVKITKGTGLGFAGLAIGMALAFLGRVMVARIGTEAEYGVFTIAFIILSVCTFVGTLGLEGGVSRSIAFARGKHDMEKALKLIPVSVQLGLITSISLGVILFFTASFIATEVFNDESYRDPLKIIAFGIPFFTLINVLIAIFRGFDDVKPQVYFRDILRSALFPLFLVPLLFFDLSFDYVFYIYLASLIVCFIVLLAYSVRRLGSTMRFNNAPLGDPVARELLIFSLPLLGVVALEMVISSTDTLMLGAIKTSTEVGQYNAAYPLAHFVSIPLNSVIWIYTPVATGLYAQGRISEIKENFTVLTKWVSAATIPVFLILFLYPETVITFLFGEGYAAADNAMRILSAGFIANNLLGPNTATIVAMGDTRFVLWATLITAGLNIGLNIALIPSWGMEGAAVAAVAATASINILTAWKLYRMSKVHPFRANLLKPILVSVVLVFSAHLIVIGFISIVWWMLPLIFLVFYAVYGASLLVTRSVDKEDIALMLAIEERAGINAVPVKRFLQRFL